MSAAAKRIPHDDGKIYFSYEQIHATITSLVPQMKEFKPDVIIAIGGGGFIPARMLRTQLRVPILAVSLELYDDATLQMTNCVRKIQWFDETSDVGKQVRGKRILIVDEVDDSRTTLKYCVDEIIRTNAPAAIAVSVVHNKMKPKKAQLPSDVVYMAGEDVPDNWNCYPWEAEEYDNTIAQHEALARKCAGENVCKCTKCSSGCSATGSTPTSGKSCCTASIATHVLFAAAAVALTALFINARK